MRLSAGVLLVHPFEAAFGHRCDLIDDDAQSCGIRFRGLPRGHEDRIESSRRRNCQPAGHTMNAFALTGLVRLVSLVGEDEPQSKSLEYRDLGGDQRWHSQVGVVPG